MVVLFTAVRLTLLRGYKLLLEQTWIPAQAWGIPASTVHDFDTAVRLLNAGYSIHLYTNIKLTYTLYKT